MLLRDLTKPLNEVDVFIGSQLVPAPGFYLWSSV